MITPEETHNERERLLELESYGIMDTKYNQDFDRITEMASEICGTRISLISLLDDKRQWFKSKHGLEATETPREISFCGHAIHAPSEVFIVNDARKDERFFDNPLVTGEPNVIFYSGVPIVSKEGLPLGTLCVIDHEPKELNACQIKILRSLAEQAMRLIEMHKKNQELEQLKSDLEYKNKTIEHFTTIAANEFKSPLKNIEGYIKLIQRNPDLTEDVKSMISMISSSSDKLGQQINKLLEYSRVDQLPLDYRTVTNPLKLVKEIEQGLCLPDNAHIKASTSVAIMDVNIKGLKLVLRNLINNAIQHNNRAELRISVHFSQTDIEYKCVVKDNGPMIDPKNIEKIFKPFEAPSGRDKNGNKISRIGLATAKRIIDRMGGTIEVQSEPDVGNQFVFYIRKAKYTSGKYKLSGVKNVNFDMPPKI